MDRSSVPMEKTVTSWLLFFYNIIKRSLITVDVVDNQCFGSGLNPDSIRSVEPDQDSGGQK
jgi:hypothetical protein